MFRISIVSLIIIVILFLISACTTDMSPLKEESAVSLPRSLTSAESELISSNQSFGLKLFQSVTQTDSAENIFISPLSVSMALGMTLNGAAGQTYEDMKNTLEFNGLSEDEINECYKTLIDLLTGLDEKVLFEIANSIWYEQTFYVEQAFFNKNKGYFDAEISPLDFNDPQSVTTINDWVNEKTHGKIIQIINNIPPFTIMYLINAIYFKGTWFYEFDKENTTTEPFYLPEGAASDCQLMKMTANLNYYSDQSIQIVDLPYGKGNYCMTVILPEDGQNPVDFISNLTERTWNYYIDNMELLHGTVELPKLKLNYKISMKDILSSMGMSVAFNSASADFTRINSDGNLYISNVLHKTFVQVDEEGTEAAAVTAVVIGITSISDKPKLDFYMRIDRPFIFIIREQISGTIVFMGKISNPIWNE